MSFTNNLMQKLISVFFLSASCFFSYAMKPAKVKSRIESVSGTESKKADLRSCSLSDALEEICDIQIGSGDESGQLPDLESSNLKLSNSGQGYFCESVEALEKSQSTELKNVYPLAITLTPSQAQYIHVYLNKYSECPAKKSLVRKSFFNMLGVPDWRQYLLRKEELFFEEKVDRSIDLLEKHVQNKYDIFFKITLEYHLSEINYFISVYPQLKKAQDIWMKQSNILKKKLAKAPSGKKSSKKRKYNEV